MTDAPIRWPSTAPYLTNAPHLCRHCAGLPPALRHLCPVVRYLNRILAADPRAVSQLFLLRHRCNEELADDPTCQVRSDTYGEHPVTPVKVSTVSALGMLNGLFGVGPDCWGLIEVDAEDVDGGVLKNFHVRVTEKVSPEGEPPLFVPSRYFWHPKCCADAADCPCTERIA